MERARRFPRTGYRLPSPWQNQRGRGGWALPDGGRRAGNRPQTPALDTSQPLATQPRLRRRPLRYAMVAREEPYGSAHR
jgi:hypothetical protein